MTTLGYLAWQGCTRVAKLLRELVPEDAPESIGLNGVRTCIAILQTSVGEELGEAFDQVLDSRFVFELSHVSHVYTFVLSMLGKM